MFCPNCGSELRDGARFCGACGMPVPETVQPKPEAPAAEPAPAPEPVMEPVQAPASEPAASAAEPEAPAAESAPEAPAETAVQPAASAEPGPILRRSHELVNRQSAGGVPGETILGRKRGHSIGVIAGIAAAAVAAVLLIAFVIAPAVVQAVSPKAYLTSCLTNTLSAYAEEWEKTGNAIGISPLYKAAQSDAMEAHVSVKLKEVPGEPMMSGMGAELNGFLDVKKREAAYEASAQYGSVSLGSVQLYLKDDLVAVGSPKYTRGAFYGLHTETFGRDVLASDWGSMASLSEDFGFNAFDMAEQYMDPKDVLSASTYAALGKKTAEFIGAAKIEKGGTQEQTVNGETEKLKMYTVTPEPKAIAKYVVDCATLVLNDEKLFESMKPMLEMQAIDEATGMTARETFDEMKNNILDELDPIDIEDNLPEAIELTIGTRGKQIALLSLKMTKYGERVSLSAELGTKSSLINALTLTARAGDSRSVLTSTGSHDAKGGKFTDETTVRINGETIFRMSVELDTKAKEDNFRLSLGETDGGISLRMNGTVHADGKSMTMNLDRVTFEGNGDSLILALEYSLKKGGKAAFEAKEAKLITAMTEDQLEELAEDIQMTAQDMMYELMGASFGDTAAPAGDGWY